MNIINVAIDFTNGTNKITGINLVTGDYASTKIVFSFDRADGRKVFEMKNPSGQVVYAGDIVNNEVILAGEDNGEVYSVFNEAGFYIYEVSLYNGNSKLTSTKGQLPVDKEQVVIGEETIEPYLPIFDELMQEINNAITQTNNLNISVEKINGITTIVLTKKNGDETDTIIEDLQFRWDGTKLGIKTSSETEYQYVDLKGAKGDPGALKVIKVNQLPTEDIQEDAIYLVPMPVIEVAELPATGQMYTIYIVTSTQKRYRYVSGQWVETIATDNNLEYMYVDNEWELVGQMDIEIDLTDYVKNTDYASFSKAGVVKAGYYLAVESGTGKTYAEVLTYNNYSNSAGNNSFIGKGTLENVITGKGLVSNTNYANTSTGGVIKIAGETQMYTTGTGFLYAYPLTYAQYSTKSEYAFINKGTLDNVLTEKIGSIDSVLDALNGEVI